MERVVISVAEIIGKLLDGDESHCYFFTIHNLSSHHLAQIRIMVEVYGHRLVFYSPHWAADGPIKYMFNTIQNVLSICMHQIRNTNDCIHEISNGIESYTTRIVKY